MTNLETKLKKQFLYQQALKSILKINDAVDRINASSQKKAA